MIGRRGTGGCIPLQSAGAAASLYEHGREGMRGASCDGQASTDGRHVLGRRPVPPHLRLPAKPASGGRKESPRAAEIERSGFIGAAQQEK